MHSPLRILLLIATLFGTTLADRASGQDLSSQVLQEMNLARTQPQRYAQILASSMSGQHSNSRDVAEAVRFLQRATPLPPLAFSPGMSQGARLHVNDLGPRGGRGHSGRGGSTPFSRINRFGQWVGTAGENIYYGTRTARGIVCALIVDSGVRNRGHRKNIFSANFTVAGIAHGKHAGFGAICVIDFAGGYVEKSGAIAGL